MLLGLYRTLTTLGGPLFQVLLRLRARRGKEVPERLGERAGRASLPRPPGRLVWLHGASVGESLAALALIELMLDRRRDLHILVTTGTVTSARLMADRLPPRAHHQFLPIDRLPAWHRFFDHWRPEFGVLVESEFWPNLLVEASRRAIPLALINGRMSARSFARWRRLPATAHRLLGALDLCLAQSEADARRLRELGARRVRVAGNLKLAATPLNADPMALDALAAAIGARPVWLAASTHPGEEAQIFSAHQVLLERWPDLLLMVVPRHPERGPAITDAAMNSGLEAARRSAGDVILASTRVYVADTLGELGLFYRRSPVAFVGGSLVRHGGQNPLEAARLGCVPIFGPHTWNFAEITAALVEQAAAVRVLDPAALTETVARLLADPGERAAFAERAERAAMVQAEVLEATFEALDRLLHPVGGDAQP